MLGLCQTVAVVQQVCRTTQLCIAPPTLMKIFVLLFPAAGQVRGCQVRRRSVVQAGGCRRGTGQGSAGGAGAGSTAGIAELGAGAVAQQQPGHCCQVRAMGFACCLVYTCTSNALSARLQHATTLCGTLCLE